MIKKANEDNIYTINITDPTREVKLNNRMAVSSPKTDWGDGVEDDKLSHVYTEAGHYTIVSNLLPGRNLGRVTERDKEWLLTAKLGSFAPTDMSMYFANAFNMTRCDLSNVDFSHVTDMSYLFKDNYRLTDIIWDTDPHVVIVDTTTHIEVADLMMTLNGSNYAYQIDDAINVTTVSYSSDGGVVELRPQFDKETRALTLKGGSIPVTNLKVDYEKEALVYSGTMDTRKVVSMRHAFGNCQSLKRLDLSQWDFAACTDFSHLFFNCQSLSEVIFKQGSTIPGNMDFMFANCYSLSNINAIEPVFEFTPKSISFMFANCIGLGDSGMTLTFEAEANTKNMFLKCEIQFRTDEATQTIIEANRNHGAKELTYRF